MTNYWVLQGNVTSWDKPEAIRTHPTMGWSVTGVQDKVEVGDGVLVWLADRNPALRGIHAAGKVTGPPRPGYPKGWGSPKQRSSSTWFVPLAIHWYLTHHPVTVHELTRTNFSSNLIMTMPRRTAYPCSPPEFDAAIDLCAAHGPTALPAWPGDDFNAWWDTV